MLTIKSVSPTPVGGQYWAWLNPLSLLQVTCGSPADIYSFIRWTPGEEKVGDLSVIAPLNDNYRLLRWYHLYTNEGISKDLGVDFKVRTGDVFETVSSMLVFAVLEPEGVTLYSDERVTYGDRLIDSVVQRGPGPVDKSVKTRYERIIDESNANLSLVRPMDRALLREKDQDLVRLSHPDFRLKNPTITNLQLLQNAEQERLYNMK